MVAHIGADKYPVQPIPYTFRSYLSGFLKSI